MKRDVSFLILLTKIVLIDATESNQELNLNFQQDDYKLTFERLELVRFSKDYVKEMSIVTTKYNRSQAVANWTFTFNVDLGDDLVWVVQAYKFMSNEYRLFPIHFAALFCKTLTANTCGIRAMFSCGNFTGCPLVKKRKYHVCNYYPDEKTFPPFIPNGNYKVEAQAEYFSKEVFVLSAYGSVTRPLGWHN